MKPDSRSSRENKVVFRTNENEGNAEKNKNSQNKNLLKAGV